TSLPSKVGAVVLKEIRSLNLTDPKILELGCGTGWLAGELTRDNVHYIGCDLSPKAIALAKRKAPRGRFEATDFMLWNVPEQPFDMILSIDTIAYFRDQDAAVRKITSLLKPRGYVILTTVNPFVYSRRSDIGPPGDAQIRNWLTRKQLHRLLTNNSLIPLRSWTILPSGDKGILRVVNSHKLNRLIGQFVSQTFIEQVKEWCGLGQYRVVVARRDVFKG
ncbi:MAG: class I SAM-dependent methyltransferase, partial [Anaerolineae bacterium]|nr:class I SAM-dependent methyltransferase [Anaerolineae bacterium]